MIVNREVSGRFRKSSIVEWKDKLNFEEVVPCLQNT